MSILTLTTFRPSVLSDLLRFDPKDERWIVQFAQQATSPALIAGRCQDANEHLVVPYIDQRAKGKSKRQTACCLLNDDAFQGWEMLVPTFRDFPNQGYPLPCLTTSDLTRVLSPLKVGNIFAEVRGSLEQIAIDLASQCQGLRQALVISLVPFGLLLEDTYRPLFAPRLALNHRIEMMRGRARWQATTIHPMTNSGNKRPGG